MIFALVELFRAQLYFVVDVPTYLIFHNVMEFFSIIASFSIFTVSWFTYKQSRDDNVLFLGCMFLGVGLLDFIHTLSFPGEPAFFTANSTNKVVLFWLAARLLFAIAFFVSAFMPRVVSWFGRWRHALLAAVLLYSFAVFYVVIFHESTLPVMFILGSGLTPLKIYLEYTVIGLLILAYAAYLRIYLQRKEVAVLWYLIAITISIFSELAFTLFKSMYDTFNMLGHLYKFLAFCAIYAGVFIVAIRSPYVRVAETATELQEDIIFRKNAERYIEKIINSANAMIVGLDLGGKVTLFNEAAEKISGYRKDEVMGHNWFELIVPQNRFPKVWKVFEEFRKQGKSIVGDFENPILTKSGEERIIEWRNSDLLDGSKVIGTISYGIDITERKQVEEALKKSEGQLLLEIARMPIGHILWDKEFRVVTWNPAAENIFGFSASEAIGKHPYDFIVPKSAQPQIDDIWRRLLIGDMSARSVNENTTKDGRTIMCDWINTPLKQPDGTIIGVVAMVQDITERTWAEGKLRENEKELIEAQRIGRIGNWSWDIATDKIVWSEEYYYLIGFDPKKSPPGYDEHLKAYTEESQDRLDAAVKKQMQTGESYELDLEFTNPKSACRWITARSETERDTEGKIVGLRGTAQDITEHKLEEVRLKELDKLKDDFLMVTTHELKSPLIPIKSQSQLLLAEDYGKLNKEQKDAIGMILRNEEAINSLASELLDISKLQSGKLQLILESTDIGGLVTEVVGDMKSFAAQKQITFSLAPIPEMPKIMADESRVKQVLRNLLDNAIKFTSDGGVIIVGMKKMHGDVVIQVQDSGIGIDKDDISKLFVPFFRAESDVTRKYRGTGLGLAVSKGLVEAHGGTIKAESEGEGRGSTFTFTLPLPAVPAQSSQS